MGNLQIECDIFISVSYELSHFPVQSVLRTDGVIGAPMEVELKDLIISLQRSSAQNTNIVRETLYDVQLLVLDILTMGLCNNMFQLTAVCPLFLKVPLDRRESLSTSLVSSLLASEAILTYQGVREH